MADDLLAEAETLRVSTLTSLDQQQQARLGQFFTPGAAAALMAGMPRVPAAGGPLRVLDPGAGSGILMAALVGRIVEDSPGTPVQVTAVEVDEAVIPALRETAGLCVEWAKRRGTTVTVDVRCEDLIYANSGPDSKGPAETFDLVIMNPPYGKLGRTPTSDERWRRQGSTHPICMLPSSPLESCLCARAAKSSRSRLGHSQTVRTSSGSGGLC